MTELSASLNIVGLILDIFGACLIFKFGLPADLRRGGVTIIISSEIDKAEAKKAKQYDFWSRVGLVALIFGFCIQAIGNAVLI